MESNPWGGTDEVDVAPPIFRRSSSPQTPPTRDDQWTIPTWTTPVREQGPATPVEGDDHISWTVSDAPELEPVAELHATPLSAPSSPPTLSEHIDVPADSPESQYNGDRSAELPTKAEDDFGEFGETRLETRDTGSWATEAVGGWGGSADWPAVSTMAEAAEKDEPESFPSPKLELPGPSLEPPKWELPATEMDRADSIPTETATEARLTREEEPEDAWAAQARANADSRPTLPPKIPVELLSLIQDQCRQLMSTAFVVDPANAFSPAAGMGLSLTSLLDSNGELSSWSSLRSIEMPPAVPGFTGSAVERLYRSAVEMTAAKSAEIIKGSNARRGSRFSWSSGSGDIWAPNAQPTANGNMAGTASAFDVRSGLDTPMLPSERKDSASLDGVARMTSPPPSQGGLFSLFGRRTPSGASTNMPASLLQPKKIEPILAPPAPPAASPMVASTSTATRRSEDSVTSAPRSVSPAPPSSMPPNAANADAGVSAMSRFWGRISKVRPSSTEEGWFRRNRDEMQFPPSRYQDHAEADFKDEVGFTYDDEIAPVSMSPSTSRDRGSQDLDEIFGVFAKPSNAQKPAATAVVASQARLGDPFQLLQSSPDVSRASEPTNISLERISEASSSSRFTALSHNIERPANASEGPSTMATLTAPVKKPVNAPPLSAFALAPPPSSIQPLNRSTGTSLLDLDEEMPSATVLPDASATFAVRPAPPVKSRPVNSAVIANQPAGSALTSQDLSFFDTL